MFKVFRVEGDSLFPLLKDKELLFCLKTFSFSKIDINDFVLFKDKTRGFMVKKVISISKKGYFVKGENAFSYDSRDFGELKKSDILYKVFINFKTFL